MKKSRPWPLATRRNGLCPHTGTRFHQANPSEHRNDGDDCDQQAYLPAHAAFRAGNGQFYQRVSWDYPDIVVFQQEVARQVKARADAEEARLAETVVTPMSHWTS